MLVGDHQAGTTLMETLNEYLPIARPGAPFDRGHLLGCEHPPSAQLAQQRLREGIASARRIYEPVVMA